jgi:RNA polymerase sigma-70 factor (ECF subfamily)
MPSNSITAQNTSFPTLADEQLAHAIQQGHTASLAALVERHHAPLTGFLYRITGGDRGLAQDLAQETFLRALRAMSRGQYRYPRPFKPWLYAIAVNLARDHYRQAETRRTDSASDDEAAWEAAVGAETTQPESRLLSQAEARQVADAMMALPLHQREAILLRYCQDLSLAEIAEALNIPVGTVKSRLSLGVRRLKEMLKNDEGQRTNDGSA